MSRDVGVDITVSCSLKKKRLKHKTIVRICAAASILVNGSVAGGLRSGPGQDVKVAAVQPHCSLMCATLAAAAS